MEQETLPFLINRQVASSGIIRTGAELRDLVDLQENLWPVWADQSLGVPLSTIGDSQYVMLPLDLAFNLGLAFKAVVEEATLMAA